jgi:RimJ/RimL family protein N-acetyltransferase
LVSLALVMFTTERLRLRSLKESDFELLLALYNDPPVAKGMLGPGSYLSPISSDYFKDTYIKAFKGSLMFCILEELSSGEFIGFACFMEMKPKNRNAQFGIGLKAEYHNKGYGTEVTSFMVDYAFRNLGAHRVSLSVYSNNDGAFKMYKRMCVRRFVRISLYESY